jgi:hypothetical protein
MNLEKLKQRYNIGGKRKDGQYYGPGVKNRQPAPPALIARIIKPDFPSSIDVYSPTEQDIAEKNS